MQDFYNGEIILIDKPQGWTSFDIVNKVRITIARKYGKKLKVGHAGTLDPLATGLLILCTGKKTKIIKNFIGLDKEYIAKINFGATTPSYDKETAPTKQFETKHITNDLLSKTIETFIGKQLQTPPLFSAKKIKGQKAYDIARQGKTINIEPVQVEFKKIKIIDTAELPNSITIKTTVSKGTYIRTFANDLGKKINSGAYLDELRRTAIGNYTIKNALSIEKFCEIIDSTGIDKIKQN